MTGTEVVRGIFLKMRPSKEGMALGRIGRCGLVKDFYVFSLSEMCALRSFEQRRGMI